MVVLFQDTFGREPESPGCREPRTENFSVIIKNVIINDCNTALCSSIYFNLFSVFN